MRTNTDAVAIVKAMVIAVITNAATMDANIATVVVIAAAVTMSMGCGAMRAIPQSWKATWSRSKWKWTAVDTMTRATGTTIAAVIAAIVATADTTVNVGMAMAIATDIAVDIAATMVVTVAGMAVFNPA